MAAAALGAGYSDWAHPCAAGIEGGAEGVPPFELLLARERNEEN